MYLLFFNSCIYKNFTYIIDYHNKYKINKFIHSSCITYNSTNILFLLGCDLYKGRGLFWLLLLTLVPCPHVHPLASDASTTRLLILHPSTKQSGLLTLSAELCLNHVGHKMETSPGLLHRRSTMLLTVGLHSLSSLGPPLLHTPRS
jgi:hypothetical protein